MRASVAMVVVVGSLMLAVGGAGAATTEYESHFKKFKLSWQPASVTFGGKIASEKGKCMRERKVKVVRKRSGRKDRIGTARTDRRGKFEIQLVAGSPARGKYHAVAKKRSYRNGGKQIVCERGKSPEIKVI